MFECEELVGDIGLDSNVSLQDSQAAPGLLHIVHNASDDIIGAMRDVSVAVDQLAAVAAFLSNKHWRGRMLETCFCSPAAREFHAPLKAFNAEARRGRWGSTASACKLLLDLERPLRHFWDMQRYAAAMPEQDGALAAAKKDAGPKIGEVNAAIESPVFWACLRTADFLFGIARDVFKWVEGCPCHSRLQWGIAERGMKKRWSACPLRGARLPEVAARDLIDQLQSLFRVSTAMLLLAMPSDVPSVDITACTHDFDRGRAHLIFVLSMKLFSWRWRMLTQRSCFERWPSAWGRLATIVRSW